MHGLCDCYSQQKGSSTIVHANARRLYKLHTGGDIGLLQTHDSCNSACIKQQLRQEQWMLTPRFTFFEHKISRSSNDLLTSMHGTVLGRLCSLSAQRRSRDLYLPKTKLPASPPTGCSNMNVALPDSIPSLSRSPL